MVGACPGGAASQPAAGRGQGQIVDSGPPIELPGVVRARSERAAAGPAASGAPVPGPVSPQLALLTPAGRELLDRLATEPADPDRALRLAQNLRGRYPPDLVAAALTQQALRVSARAKFSRAGAMLFTRPGLEQASGELAARHSAARYGHAAARVVADLCCGIGGNLGALAAGRRVIAVDADLASAAFARHNAAVSGGDGEVAVACADVRDLPLARPGPGSGAGRAAAVDAVFIDPARRAGGRRLRAGHSEPSLAFCLGLAEQVPATGIKAAPGLPLELVPPGWEAEFLAVGRNLKEALLWSPALATAPRRATVLVPGENGEAGRAVTHTLTSVAGPPVQVAAPAGFLLDPSPAVTRAGLVEDLARQLGAWKIDPMIAFLSADQPVRTPFARTMRILDSIPWIEKQVARRLRQLGIGAADIRRRGLAGDVGQIRRRLGLRGEGRATIVMTRRSDEPWCLICSPLDPPQPASELPSPQAGGR
jgi:SAM-dependent methyltransferase